MRLLKYLLITIIVLVVLVVGVAWFYGGSIVKDGIETEAPPITGTDVTVDSVGLNLIGGTAGIGGLFIGNPQGFTSPHAFKLGSVDVALDVESLLSDEIIIHSIDIRDPDLILEYANGTTNLQSIQRNVMSGSASAPADEDPDAVPKTYVIERVTITGARVGLAGNVPGLGDQSQEIELPDITLENIGRKGNGVLAREAAQQIMKPVMKKVQKHALKGGIEKFLDDVGGDGVKGIGDKVKGLFD